MFIHLYEENKFTSTVVHDTLHREAPMKDVALHLRYESKRTDLPDDVIQTLSEAYAEISRLERERDEARRQVCKDAGILRSVYVDPDQDINEWANYIAKEKGWDCFKEENTNG